MSLTKDTFLRRIQNDYTYVKNNIHNIPIDSYVMYYNPCLNKYYMGGIAKNKFINKNNKYITLKSTFNNKFWTVKNKPFIFYYKLTNTEKEVSFRKILETIVTEHSVNNKDN